MIAPMYDFLEMITRKIPLLSHNEVYHRRTIKFPSEHTQINGRVAPYLISIISGAAYMYFITFF